VKADEHCSGIEASDFTLRLISCHYARRAAFASKSQLRLMVWSR
jgi:hypothetical protein